MRRTEPHRGIFGRCVVLACSAIALSGCRLDDTRPSSSADIGAGDTGADLIGAADAGNDGSGDADPHSTMSRCVVVATAEFGAEIGSVAIIDADTLESRVQVTSTHSDAVVVADRGRVFVVNRLGADNVQELDPEAGFRVVRQHSVGRGSNPWDLRLLRDDLAVVARYGEGDLLPLSLGEPTRALEPIRLDAVGESDGRVEPSNLLRLDDTLVVVAQGLDQSRSFTCGLQARARLHAFDVDSLEPAPRFDGSSHLELRGCNPTGIALIGEHRLLVGHAGNFRALDGTAGIDATRDDGGLELVDLVSGTSSGFITTESDAQGRDIAALSVGDDDRVWVALASGAQDSALPVSVHRARLNAPAGEVYGEALWESEGVYDVQEAFGRVWIVDRSPTAPGVAVLDAESGAPMAGGVIDTGYPPYDLAFVQVEGGCF